MPKRNPPWPLEIVPGAHGRRHARISYVRNAARCIIVAAEKYENPSPRQSWLRRRNLYPLFARTNVRASAYRGAFAGAATLTRRPAPSLPDTNTAAAEFGWRATTPFRYGLRNLAVLKSGKTPQASGA